MESSNHFGLASGALPLLNDWICLVVRAARRWMTVGFARCLAAIIRVSNVCNKQVCRHVPQGGPAILVICA